jgi:hypothetical protein
MAKDLGAWTAEDCALALALEGSEYRIRVTGIDLVVDGGMKVW